MQRVRCVRPQNPLRHIAEILLKKSEDKGEESPNVSSKRRVSLDGPPPAVPGEKKAGFASGGVEVFASKESVGNAISGDAELTREYVTKDAVMPADLEAKLKVFFDAIDADKNGEVTKDEAVAFWGKNFAKLNAQSMFNEVDADGNESISWDEFRKFFQNVIGSGYPAEAIAEEVDLMLKGGSWVDFDDGRTT